MALPQRDEPAFEDLTARARIRDSALRLFTERGFDGTTIRDIAKAAGVSSGLVRHHFGSKEALREAVDRYAVDWSTRVREQMLAEGRLSDPAFMSTVQPTAILMQSYIVRSMLDGSDHAAAMFDDMVELGEQWLADNGIESRDPRAFSAVLCAMQLGAFAMRDQVSRALGVDVGTPPGHARMMRGFVEVFSHPLLPAEQAEQMHAAFDRLQAHPPSRGARDAARTKE
jgi:TetR/AcrR family transcriptional regulator, regulator of cefoperazone and chloramphenicol sensitivity